MNVIHQACGENWALYNADAAEAMQGLPPQSIDLAIFSPPFSSLYTYSPSERDLGNCRSDDEFFEHFGFITRELLRVLRPGRNVCVHVQQLTTTKATHGVIGMRDFRGDVIRHFTQQGFVFHGEVTIDKDPQAQAIRTKAVSLMFATLERDSIWLRPALADFILIFRVPGENRAPIHPDVSRDEWICWARPVWYGIRETDTLNVTVARRNDDERHLCPLQLSTIERCVRLWSNRGETVLDPFNGIGSTGVVAIQFGRRYVGIELKPEYAAVAARNLAAAETAAAAPSLFESAGVIGDSHSPEATTVVGG